MNLRHTIAVTLIAGLSIPATAFAQRSPEPVPQPIPYEQALRILVNNLRIGAQLRIEVTGGTTGEGRFVEKSDSELVIAHEHRRETLQVSAVTGVRAPTRRGMGRGKAFAIGAADRKSRRLNSRQ